MYIYTHAYTDYNVNWPNKVIVVVCTQYIHIDMLYAMMVHDSSFNFKRLAGRCEDSTLDQHTTLCTI